MGATRHYLRGFTLVELSLVIVIIAAVTAMSVSSGETIIQSARQAQTQSKMATIKQALYTFRKNSNRMPCPASLVLTQSSSNFGMEGPNSASCLNAGGGAATATNNSAGNIVSEGSVPVRTIGLPDDFAYDGWGNRIRYAVTVAYTSTNAFTTYFANNTSVAAVKILDGTGASNYRTQNALYALVSHGINGAGAYGKSGSMVDYKNTSDSDEQQNCHCNNSGATTYDGKYVQKSPTSTFDDAVDYGMRYQQQTLTEVPYIVTVTPPGNGTYTTGQAVTFTVNYSAAVTITGTPQLDLTVGAAAKYATYVAGSSTPTALVFTYTVGGADLDTDGIGLASPVDLNGGTIVATSGGVNAGLTFTPPTLTGVLVGATGPTITSVSPPSSATYSSGQALNFTVNYTAAVTVTGTPYIPLSGGSLSSAHVSYVSGSGTTALVFRYTLGYYDWATSGALSVTSPILLNGGTMVGTSGGVVASLIFTPPSLAGVHIRDACSVTDGNDTTCAGCDGVPNSGKTVDACGVCGGNGSECGGGGCPWYDACGVCQGDGSSCGCTPPSCGSGYLNCASGTASGSGEELVL